MKVLLDTCAVLALAGTAGRLSRSASRALTAPEDVFISPVTAWEIAIKVKTGKLHLEVSPHDWFQTALEHYQIREIPINTSLLCAAADLPLIHRDPFDRVIIATAMAQQLVVLSSDLVIPTYPGVKVVW
jgi:PIN domain nuclease of toxin-antitoxin system